MNSYRIIQQPATRHPLFYSHLYSGRRITNLGISDDYTIDNIEEILDSCSIENSKRLWNTLLEYGTYGNSKFLSYELTSKHIVATSSYCDKARYSPNGSAPVKECESSLLFFLKTYKWLPNKAGQLFKPADITIDELDASFKVGKDNILIAALKIGENFNSFNFGNI